MVQKKNTAMWQHCMQQHVVLCNRVTMMPANTQWLLASMQKFSLFSIIFAYMEMAKVVGQVCK